MAMCVIHAYFNKSVLAEAVISGTHQLESTGN